MNQRFVLGVGGLAAIAVGVGLMASGNRTPPEPISAHASAAEAAAPAVVHTCEFPAGATLAYAVDMRSTMALDMQGLAKSSGSSAAPVSAGATRPLSTHVTAKLHAAPLGAPTEKGQVLAAVLGETVIEAGDAKRDLSPPFLLRVGKDCGLTGFARRKTTPKGIGRQQQAMIYELDGHIPSADSPARREAEDSVGRYAVTFVALAGKNAGEATLERRNVSYAALWGHENDAAGQAAPKLASSKFGAKFDNATWFAEVEMERTMALPHGAGTSSVVESAKRIAPSPPSAAALAAAPRDEAEYIWEDLLPYVELRRAGANGLVDEKVAELTPDQAIARYPPLFDTQAHMATAIGFLRAYLLAHPEFAYRIMDEVKKGKFEGVQSGSVFVALQQTPTPQAKDALMRAKLASDARAMDRMRSTLALADRADVGREYVKTLVDDARKIGSRNSKEDRAVAGEALLSLGVMAKRTAASDPETAKAARDALSAKLQEGKGVEELGPTFGGIANAGYVGMLPEVVPFTRIDDPPVRESAASAFRNMPVKATAEFTEDWLKREVEPGVKRQIYVTAFQQAHDQAVTPDTRVLDQAIADLQAQPESGLRHALIRILGAASTSYPPAREALTKQFAIEKEQLLRQLIGTYLTAAELSP